MTLNVPEGLERLPAQNACPTNEPASTKQLGRRRGDLQGAHRHGRLQGMRLRPLLTWAGLTPLRRAVATVVAVLAVSAVGVLEYATGAELSFAPLYVLVIVAVTVVAGAGVGLVAAAWSAAMWGAADILTGRSPSGPGVQVWNGLVRFVVHGIVVLLVTALLRALRAARESEARSRSFLAAAAHQLRTPVAALSASVEALLLEGASPAQERLLANVAGETSRLGRLVSSLLRTARLDQGEALRPQAVDLVDLCETELDRARQLSNLQWRLSLEWEVPQRVVLDGEATRESLANLLDNARRHASTAVEVKVRVERGHLGIHVSDDGPGLPSGAEGRAFDRFVTLDGRGGTGLGLAIARELAQRQGGDLVYTRKAFLLTLPLTDAPDGATGTRVKPPSGANARLPTR